MTKAKKPAKQRKKAANKIVAGLEEAVAHAKAQGAAPKRGFWKRLKVSLFGE